MRRHAFTLVEFLVVVAIIAVLIGLLLPAVQRVRESAAACRCKSNLRQVALALLNYHDQRGAFPVGCLEWRPNATGPQRQLAWSAFLLPFLEQEAVAARFDATRAFDDPANAIAAAAVIRVYCCPSARRVGDLADGRGATDYGGIIGERITGPNLPFKGIMIHDRGIRIGEVTDGSAQTIIVGEDSRSGDGQWINGRNLFDQAFAINQGPAFENDLRSDHLAGAHAAFADGSAHFLRNSLGLPVLAALCTRAGIEPVAFDE